MKHLSYYIISLFIASSLFLGSCRESKKPVQEEINKVEKKAEINEFELLVDYLETHEDFINSPYVPAMINTKEVFDNRNNKVFKIIDIRSEEDFQNGHIENAMNIPAEQMIYYFENEFTPSDYESIAMVCYSGQAASYVTGVMRMLGYDNVFAMKFGMSSISKHYADAFWNKNISNDYADKVEMTAHSKPIKGNHPSIKTGKTTGLDILKARAQIALEIPYKSLLVKAPELFKANSNRYILNYWPTKMYDMGHIPGAIQYTPKKSLSTKTALYTLPVNKEIVTYCFTGQHAAFVTAHLQVLGYNAKALAYGSNSFMNKEMKKRGKKWHPFSKKKIGHYKVVAEELAQ